MPTTEHEGRGGVVASDARRAGATSPAGSPGEQTALLGVALAAALAVFVVPGAWDWVNVALGVTLLLVLIAYDRDPETSWPHLLAFGAVWGMCCVVMTGFFFELGLEAYGREPSGPDFNRVLGEDKRVHYGVSHEKASRLEDYETAAIWLLFGALGTVYAGVKRGRWAFLWTRVGGKLMGRDDVNEPGQTPAPDGDDQPEPVPSGAQGEGGGTAGEHQAAPSLDNVPPAPAQPEITLSQKRPPSAYRASAGRWYSRLTLAVSILSLVVITVHAYYYNKQWRVMTEQAELIERQVKQSTDAFTIQQRAWIFMATTNYSVGEFGDPGEPKAKRAKADIGFRNTGSTPALNTKVWFCAQLRERPLPANIPRPEAPSPSCAEFPFGVIGQGAQFNIGQTDEERVVDAETAAKLDRGELKLYIWGVVDYEDFFQQRHATRFCFTNTAAKLLMACENNNSAN